MKQGAGRELASEMFVPLLCSHVARVKSINTRPGLGTSLLINESQLYA